MDIGSVTNLSTLMPQTSLAQTAGTGTSANSFAALMNDSGTGSSQSAASGTDDGPDSASTNPAQTFLNYMKETPAQQLEDSWLASHHLTRKQLEAMSPEQRQAIEKEMAADIKEKLKQQAQQKSGTQVDLLA